MANPHITGLDDVTFGPETLDFTMTTTAGQSVPVSFTPGELQYFIGTMIEFAYRHGSNRYPNGRPARSTPTAPGDSFLQTPATHFRAGVIGGGSPTDMLVVFTVVETDIAFRIDSRDLKRIVDAIQVPEVAPAGKPH